MSSDDTDQLDARLRAALHELGAEAPPLQLPVRAGRQSSAVGQGWTRSGWFPVVGAVAAVSAIAALVGVATWSSRPDSDPTAQPGGAADPASSTVSPSQQTPGTPPSSGAPATGMVSLAALADWTVAQPGACAAIQGPTDRKVFEVDAFEVACLEAVDRAGTTVFSVPLPAELLGERLTEVTTPWPDPAPGGHELRRLTGGALAEISSTYVDGVACIDCDRLFVVMGPVPAEVRAIVESVR
jgi:hypothetical protein